MYKDPERPVFKEFERNSRNSSSSFSLPGKLAGRETCRAFLASWKLFEGNNCLGEHLGSPLYSAVSKFNRLSRPEGVVGDEDVTLASVFFSFGGVPPFSSDKILKTEINDETIFA